MSYWKKIPIWKNVSTKEWYNHDWQLSNAIRTIDQIKEVFPFLPDKHINLIKENEQKLNVFIVPFMVYQSLLCASVRKQFVPSMSEIKYWDKGFDDPLSESQYEKTKCLVHRYPNRVLFLSSKICGANCRFCTRKRIFDTNTSLSNIRKSISYIESNPSIEDVLISGGDPLLLDDMVLKRIIKSIYSIPHVKIIRIGTRVPVTLPFRINKNLLKMFKKYKPIYMNIHVNHRAEITPEMENVVEELIDAGVQLGSQSVLLRGVNDDVTKLKKLFNKLIHIRIKPYYLYMCDPVVGAAHYRVSVDEAFRLMDGLEGHLSGMAIPKLIYDIPNGGGKKIINNNKFRKEDNKLYIKNFEGKEYRVK